MKGLGYSPDEFIGLITQNGWKFSHKKSNHITYKKDNIKSIITVPTHRHEISRPIVVKLLKIAGLK
jgi:predicted RNA binding protein YcfA (HicA-like mRNA interferase family)